MGGRGSGAHRPDRRRWLAGALLALAADAARADVFVVDTALDTSAGSCPANPVALPGAGSCSLRDAIAAANSSAGNDLILFAPAVFGQPANKVITLGSPLPSIAGTVEINATSPLLSQRAQGIVVRAGTGVAQLFAVTAGAPQLDDLGLEGAGLAIGTGARLVFAQTVDATFAQAISGAGALEKLGAARLVLTGTNSYGETLIEAGTLQGDTRSIPGNDVNDDALLVFDQEATDDPDFSGAIRGIGRLQKIGAGELRLTEPNSYSGGTTVSAGTLFGFAGNAETGGSLQGAIQNDAILVFEPTPGALPDGTFSGSIRGSGRVEKTGASLLVLTGSNTWSGGTKISGGRLQGDADAIPGDVAIASGARLIFDEAGTGTHSGRITGGGGLLDGEFTVEKSGAGTLTLSGANTYVGGTFVSGGTLRGDTQSLQGDFELAATTALVFDQAFAGAYSGLLAGEGTLEKRGSGTLVLTRDLGSGFAPLDPTTVSGGRLEVGRPGDGAILPGDVSILAGALGGVGSVGGLATVSAGAAISPGNSIGVLSVASATFASGSFLEVEVNPVEGADLLEVVGSAMIASGAQVRVIPGAGDYPAPGAGVAVPILVAGMLSGSFDPIPADAFAFLNAFLSESGNQVLLTVESNGKTLVDFAGTPNQLAVGAALEQAEAGGDPDLAEVFEELNTLQAADVPDALDAMAGEQLTEFATARLAVGQRFLAGIEQRIARSKGREGQALVAGGAPGSPALAGSPWLFAPAGLAGGAPGALAAALARQTGPLGDPPPADARGLGAWLDGYGIFGSVSGTSGSDDFDTTVWGVSAGFDASPAPGWIAGLAGGYANSRLDFDSLEGRPEVDTAQGAAYLGYTSPRLEAGAAFRYAWNHMTADRDIAFAAPSTLARTADSDFDGSDLGGRIGAGVHLVDVAGVGVQPFGSLTYTHLQQDAFDESGAGSLDLSAEEEEIDSLVSRLGARLHAVVQLDEGVWMRPELRAAWLHEFGDRERKLEARIGGTPGATFTVRGAELPRDAAELGVGWTVAASERLRFFAGYDLAVNPDLLQHSAALGLELLW
jgi:outer membrane autotransporter protein/CSLREA domain-containing protein